MNFNFSALSPYLLIPRLCKPRGVCPVPISNPLSAPTVASKALKEPPTPAHGCSPLPSMASRMQQQMVSLNNSFFLGSPKSTPPNPRQFDTYRRLSLIPRVVNIPFEKNGKNPEDQLESNSSLIQIIEERRRSDPKRRERRITAEGGVF